MTTSPGQDTTWGHAAVPLSRATVDDALQRLEEVLALGYRQGEGVPELHQCLEELAGDPVLAADHPNVVTARGHLAHWTWQAGDIAKARELFAALVPDIERALGMEHRRALDVRRRLAACTGWSGTPATARNMYADLIPVAERS